jgi:fused signal recognition particle receptor
MGMHKNPAAKDSIQFASNSRSRHPIQYRGGVIRYILSRIQHFGSTTIRPGVTLQNFPPKEEILGLLLAVGGSLSRIRYNKISGRLFMIQTLFGSVPQEPNLLDRLKAGIEKTRTGLVERLEDVIGGRKEIDSDLLEELEYTLITADIGVKTATEILESIRQRVDRKLVGDAGEIKGLIQQHLLEVLEASDRPVPRVAEPPAVVMVVGVNGSGKTTTIGKLARRFKTEGHSVLLCAADTFRAAAIDQLQVWGERTATEVIRQNPGADPSAVLFDALKAAQARKVDYVVVDTAGRLHNKANLMSELEKMSRTAAKVIPGAPHEVLLVLDATTGQNGLEQARKFTETSGVTGIVLTKLDGTAKGGIVVAIARELNLPIRYIGVGEKIDDLLPFDPEQFVASLFA